MRILALNVRSLATSRQLLEDYVDNTHIDLLALSETHNTGDTLKFKNWCTKDLFMNRRDGSSYGGVALVPHPSLKIVPRKDLAATAHPELEIVWAQIGHKNQPITVLCAYIPPKSKLFNEFLEHLKTTLQQLPPGSPILILGDLNARSPKWESRQHDHKSNREQSAQAFKRGSLIEEVARSHNLTILNNGDATFRTSGTSPDVSLIGGNSCGKVEWSTDTRSAYSQLSDHIPVIIKIDDKEEKDNTKEEKYNLKEANWPKYNNTLEAKTQALLDADLLSLPSDQIVDRITEAIISSADETIPKKVTCCHSKPFFSPEIKEKLRLFKQAKNRYRKRRDLTNQKLLDDARTDFHNTYEKAKTSWFERICQELKGRDVDLWRKVNKILNGKNSAPVQPLKISNSEDHEFDDKEIASRMESVHITRNNTDNSSFDDKFRTQIERELEEMTAEINENKEHWSDGDYNSDIQQKEIRASANKTKDDSTPGPDRIQPMFITRASFFMMHFFTNLLQTFWDRGEFPKPWKLSNVIYLPKPGKESYSHEKSYRPICLTDMLGKIFERIIARRLTAYLLKSGFFNDTQYAYQKGADCEQAILDMALDIWKGFSQKKVAAVGFIDLEGAFDAVWRKGLLYKLNKLGVKGRLFKIIESFLSNRFARSFVNSVTTNWIETLIGVPQGSVLSALLFLVYTKDIPNDPNTRYADDTNVYAIGDNPQEAANKLEAYFSNMAEWSKLWRINANPTKTTCMLVAPRGHHDIDVQFKGVKVKQVATQKVLGIILDENFRFSAHVTESAARATRALNKMCILSNTLGGASAEVMILLYKGCVLPLLEYGYSVWCPADKTPLEQVQHAALTKILGTRANTSCAAMEVLANIMPLEIRLQSTLLNTFLRILRKPAHNSLRQKIIDLRIDYNFIALNKTNPISMLEMATRQLANFTLEHIEPMAEETMEDILRPNKMQLIITDKNIGSSGNRTTEQKNTAQQVADELIINAGNDAIIFTDGSAMPNPGPCGAGICAYWAGIHGPPTETSIPVAKRSTSYHGELKAIEAALKSAAEREHKGNLHIMSDCQSALHIAASDELPPNFSGLADNIKRHTEKIDGTIFLNWVAGHANIEANERADALAKEGATNAKHADLPINIISCSEAKSCIKANALFMWKCRWLRQSSGRSYLQEINPKRRLRHIHEREIETKIHRLILQQTNLEEDLHRMLPDFHTSPACECGVEAGTVSHYLLRCPTFDDQRNKMHDAIYAGFQKHNINPNDRVVDERTVLGLNEHLPSEMHTIILHALKLYLITAKKSI